MSSTVRCPTCQRPLSISVGTPQGSPHTPTAHCQRCGTTFRVEATQGGPVRPREERPRSRGLTLPTAIGRYQIRDVLGSGAFGVVYRAYDPGLNREIALKVLHANNVTSAEAIERFLQEAQIAAGLLHPHIVPIHELGTHDGQHYIASALIEGKTLSKRIPEGGMAPERAIHLTLQLLDALSFAHEKKVIHRDVKPGNIMVNDQDHLYLMDFGLAKLQEGVSSALTQQGSLLGTPGYMSPEQASAEPHLIGPSSDMYSVGVVFYELLTGHLPFDGSVALVIYRIVNEPPAPPRKFRPDLDPALEAICLKVLAKQPAQRHASCREFANVLRGWLNGSRDVKPTSIPAPASHVKPGSSSWQMGILIGGVFLVFVALSLLAFVLFNSTRSTNTKKEPPAGFLDWRDQINH